MKSQRETIGQARKLLLHIGAHKTGTTSIQGFLSTRSNELEASGWSFVSVEGSKNLGNLVKVNEEPVPRYFVSPAGLEKLSNEIEATSLNCIISAEDFFFLNDSITMESLRKIFNHSFDQICILVYLRRQDLMAVSQKAQGAKTRPSGVIFGHSNQPLPELTEKVIGYLNYKTALDRWAYYFGKQSLHIKIYEKSRLIDQNVVSDFIAASNLKLQSEPVYLNASLGPQPTVLLHLLHESGISESTLWPLYSSRRILQIPGKISLPALEEARAFFEEFKEENQALRSAYGEELYFNNDFSMYPATTERTTLDSNYAASCLVHILTILSGVFCEDNANYLYLAGIELESKRPKLAERLLQSAILISDRHAMARQWLVNRKVDVPPTIHNPDSNKPSNYQDLIFQLKDVSRFSNWHTVYDLRIAAQLLQPSNRILARELLLIAYNIHPSNRQVVNLLNAIEKDLCWNTKLSLVLSVTRKVKRHWELAKLWLRERIQTKRPTATMSVPTENGN